MAHHESAQPSTNNAPAQMFQVASPSFPRVANVATNLPSLFAQCLSLDAYQRTQPNHPDMLNLVTNAAEAIRLPTTRFPVSVVGMRDERVVGAITLPIQNGSTFNGVTVGVPFVVQADANKRLEVTIAGRKIDEGKDVDSFVRNIEKGIHSLVSGSVSLWGGIVTSDGEVLLAVIRKPFLNGLLGGKDTYELHQLKPDGSVTRIPERSNMKFEMDRAGGIIRWVFKDPSGNEELREANFSNGGFLTYTHTIKELTNDTVKPAK